MSRTPSEDSIDHAVARLLAEPEAEATATPEVEPDAQPEAPVEAELQDEDPVDEDTETEEYEEEEGDEPTEDAEDDSESEEETEDDDEESEGKEPDVYTVKIDGEEYEVNLDELTSGYQRQKDYTKKTQAVAEERKLLEAKQAEYTAAQEDFQAKAIMANELLNRDLAKYASIDWETLKKEDPAGFLSKQIEIQDIKKSQVELQEAYAASQEQSAKAAQEAYQAKVAEEHPKVLQAFPDWKDNDKANEQWKSLMTYGREIGFADSELQNFISARDLQLLDKARKYDEIQKTKKSITKKSKPTIKKVVRPKGVAPKSAGSKRRVDEAKGNLRASGSLKDAANLLMERRLAGAKRINK